MFILGCKKSKTEQLEQSTPKTELEIVAAKDGYLPMELVETKLKEVLVSNSEVIGTIQGNTVKIALINNSALFLVPDLAPGSYDVIFSVQSKEFSVKFKVISSPTIDEPSNYSNKMAMSIDSSLNKLALYAEVQELQMDFKANVAADVVKYSELAQFYKAEYDKLSEAERRVFAKVVAANLYWISEIRTSLASLGQINRTLSSINDKIVNGSGIADYELQQNELVDKWLRSFYPLSRNIAKLTALIIVMPVTGTIPIVGTIGTGIALGYMLTEVCASLSETIGLMEMVLQASLAPYGNLSFGAAVSHAYENGQQKLYSATASFRKLILSDQSSTWIGSKLSEFLSCYATFKSTITELLGKLPSRFKPNMFIGSLKGTVESVMRSITNKYISIENISNPKVTLTMLKMPDGTISLKATTTENKDQDFTYDIVYNNLLFSLIGLKKTIQASVKGDYIYKLEYVSGNGQTYGGGGMPKPMIFKIKNVGQNTYVSGELPSNLSITATANNGYHDGAFIANGEYCGSGECYSGYYYVPSNSEKPSYKLHITVTLRKNGVVIDTYNILQNITG